MTLSEDAAPGTRVAEVTVSCSAMQGSPNVTLVRVEPGTPTDPTVTPRTTEPGHPFNPIAISAVGMPATTFRAEVWLRDTVRGGSLRGPRWAPSPRGR